MKKVYTDEMRQFILENYQGVTSQELTDKVNDKFGLNLEASVMKSYKSNHKLRTGHVWSPKYNREIKAYIFDNYQGKSNKKLSEDVNDKFGTSFNPDAIANFKARMLKAGIDLRTGINEGCYQKGRIPTNAIKKGQRIGIATEFKKGGKSHNCDPIGTEKWKSPHPNRGDDIGFLYVKVRDGAKQHNWEPKHRIIWEEKNGPIPKNHKLIFLDGDRTNIVYENLALVSNSEMLIMNKRGLIYQDQEATKTGTLIARVIDKTNKIQKRGRNDKH